MKHLLIQTKDSFDLVEEESNKLIKSFPILYFETPPICRGKWDAYELIKKLEGLAWFVIDDRIKKGKSIE
jgi:hypothetical protein